MSHKRLIGACVGASALVGSAVLATTPANAAPNWDLYNVDTSSNVSIGNTLSGYGTLTFTTNLNHFPVRIQCQVAQGSNIFTHQVTSSDQLSAAPGDDISVTFTPDATISSANALDPKYDVCEDISGTVFGSGVPMDVTTDTGATMTVSVTTPSPGTTGVYGGTLGGHLTVSDGAIKFYDPSVLCHGQGPYSGTGDISGSYDASTGVLTPTARSFVATSSDCVIGTTQLESGSITLDPQLSLIY